MKAWSTEAYFKRIPLQIDSKPCIKCFARLLWTYEYYAGSWWTHKKGFCLTVGQGCRAELVQHVGLSQLMLKRFLTENRAFLHKIKLAFQIFNYFFNLLLFCFDQISVRVNKSPSNIASEQFASADFSPTCWTISTLHRCKQTDPVCVFSSFISVGRAIRGSRN